MPQSSVFSLQGRGTFPCDISVLEIQQDLDWNPKVSTLNVWPLYICDDGAVVFYRLESNLWMMRKLFLCWLIFRLIPLIPEVIKRLCHLVLLCT